MVTNVNFFKNQKSRITIISILIVVTTSGFQNLQTASAISVVTIGNGIEMEDGSYLNAENLATTLVFTSIEVNADTEIDIEDDIDLSQSVDFGPTLYPLILIAPTINLSHNIKLGNGGIGTQGNTLNLDGQITSNGALVGPTLLHNTVTQVNVLSNAASIQQALNMFHYLSTPATVQVSAGQYHENFAVSKSLQLKGNDGTAADGADSTAPEIFGTQPGGNVITVTANNVMIDGLHLQAQVNGGSLTDSANGIYASGVSNLTISQNTIEGFCGLGILTPGSSSVTLDANLAIPTGTTEIPYNGIDEDCNGSDLNDVDQDSFTSNQSVGGTPDCNDSDNTIYPGATEIANDGIDQDCNGSDLIINVDTPPVITLLGSNPLDIELGSIYVDAGATALDNPDGDISGSIVVVNTVNTAVVGTYIISYDVTDSFGYFAVQVIRTVNVVDTTNPVITLIGNNPQTVERGSSYVEFGATVSDNQFALVTPTIDSAAVDTSTEGSYHVTYDATDDEGNHAIQVIRTVDVDDTTSPDTTIISYPLNPTSSTSASFSFTSTESGTFECQLDSTGFTFCTTPKFYSSLSTGIHTFEVRAIDTAGNVEAVPGSYTWVIDIVAPSVVFSTTAPNPTNTSPIPVTATFSEPVIGFALGDIVVTNGATANFVVVSGEVYTFNVTPTGQGLVSVDIPADSSSDAAGNGNTAATTLSRTFDAISPDTTITSSPSNPTTSTSASFSFTSTESGTFECQLDVSGFTACTIPKFYSGLAIGSHTFLVRAIDLVGNVDATPASYTWTIESTAPVISSVNDVSLKEGNSGTTNFVFTLTRSGATTGTSSVTFATSDGTAKKTSDYTSKSGTITFAVGETTKTVTISVKGDTTNESDETFSVNLSNCSNCSITDNQGVGTILNDDSEISINDVSLTEGNSGTTNFVFTLTRSGATTGTSSVTFATSDGTAKTPSDYTSKSGTITFAVGETTKTVTISVKGDTTKEKDEKFNVKLSNPVGSTITDNLGIGTIINDD